MKVIPLGTSSGKPTLKRNVSATAIAREGEWLLMDCGEATQIQIARAGLSPNRLSAIFITHLHGDHFNGLSGLLSTMGLDRRERELTLIGPPGMSEYLSTLARLKILFVNYPLEVREFTSPATGAHAGRLIKIEEGRPGASPPSKKEDDFARDIFFSGERAVPEDDGLTVVYETADYVVQSRPLDHRLFALGYRIEERPRPGRFNLGRARELGIPEGPMFSRLQSGQDVKLEDGRVIRPSDVLGPPRMGKSVAYCTDTRPCPSAVRLGRSVDLLIHEATYTKDLEEEARQYGHSTAAQAARIALEAGARRLLITHFSTRFPDPAPLLEEACAIFPDTLLAQDLMEVEA
ncbi:MAG: ribonuclease Z [Blastocatellia bacterium]|nr:ribonuclease Z [Blastocatellia bacterium]